MRSRETDLKELFSHELAPVPTSMFEDNGDMRITKSKSTLKQKLQVVQSSRTDGVARKKYNQDRTRQQKKSQKRNISHIWGKASRKDIPMKLGTGVDVHEIVKWAKFDL